MTGNYFFSFYEERAWNIRPDVQAVFPEPTGDHYDAYKEWFQVHAVTDGFMDEKTFQEWKKTWKFNQKYHEHFHPPVSSKDDIGVNVFGWHAGLFSIGISTQKIFRSAELAGLAANAIESSMVSGRKFISPADVPVKLTRSCSQAVNLVIMNADNTILFRKDVPKVIREQKKYNIGYWAWELDVFPKDWMQFLADFDEIWCPSMFIKNSLERSEGYDGTLVKVLPIPHESKDERNENDLNPSLPFSIKTNVRGGKGTEDPFVFLVVFDFLSFVERKNPEAAIRAFLDAFPKEDKKSDKYQLIVKTHSGTAEELEEIGKVAKGDHRVVFINSLLTDKENDALHKYQDCYVSLHRSEGYGMNILETIGSGIPVIATNYSGNVDFFKAMPSFEGKCTFPIPYELMELKETYGPYEKGNHWADANHKSTVKAMRRVVKNDCKQRHGKEMRREVKLNYGLEAVGEKMKSLLQEAYPRIVEKEQKGRKVS